MNPYLSLGYAHFAVISNACAGERRALHTGQGTEYVEPTGAAREREQFGILPAQRPRRVAAHCGAGFGRQCVPVPEAGLGQRELHFGFPGAQQRGIAQRAFEFAAGIGQA